MSSIESRGLILEWSKPITLSQEGKANHASLLIVILEKFGEIQWTLKLLAQIRWGGGTAGAPRRTDIQSGEETRPAWTVALEIWMYLLIQGRDIKPYKPFGMFKSLIWKFKKHL